MGAPLMLAFALAVQLPQGSIEGVVRDASTGRPVAGASVDIGDLGLRAVSGENGAYRLARVPSGPQHVVVTAFGYAARTLHAFVPVGATLSVDVSLDARPIGLAGISVESRRSAMVDAGGTRPRLSGSAVTRAAMRSDPLSPEPDALRALTGGAAVVEPEGGSGLHVLGGASGHTAYVLDGLPLLEPVHAVGLFGALDPEALEGATLHASGAPELPGALAGVVSMRTRDPGDRLASSASVTSTHVGGSAVGPIGASAGYVLSLRSSAPGALAPGDETSYVSGDVGDMLLKALWRGRAGTLAVLHHGSENELGAAALVDPLEVGSAAPGPGTRHAFAWAGATTGLTWISTGERASVVAWRATGRASGTWISADDERAIASDRNDLGAQASLRFGNDRRGLVAGARIARMRSLYVSTGAAGAASVPPLLGSSLVATVFAEETVALTPTVTAGAGASIALGPGAPPASWQLDLGWTPLPALAFSVSAARTHQQTQSLRHDEAVATQLFPAGLTVVADGRGVPIPRGDRLVVSGAWTPTPSLALKAQGFDRNVDALVVVDAAQPQPWSPGEYEAGRSRARGLSIEAGVSATRYRWRASWGWQDVRTSLSGREHRPRYAAAHALEAGVAVDPSASWSLRLALATRIGRRSTDITGDFEWEACNLLDRGCEFAGAPRTVGPTGGSELPAYASVEVGARKHWHLRIAGRESALGFFATVTNLLGRSNVLAYRVVDPESREAVVMRPRSPLVAGLEWRF